MKDTNLQGRKPVAINWPSGEFTISDVLNNIQNKLKRISVQVRLNKEISNKTIVKLDKTVRKAKMGKGEYVYSLAKEQSV